MRLDQLTKDYHPRRNRNPSVAVATFGTDGIIELKWQNDMQRFESKHAYNQFLEDHNLIGSPTDIRVLEVHLVNSRQELQKG